MSVAAGMQANMKLNEIVMNINIAKVLPLECMDSVGSLLCHRKCFACSLYRQIEDDAER